MAAQKRHRGRGGHGSGRPKRPVQQTSKQKQKQKQNPTENDKVDEKHVNPDKKNAQRQGNLGTNRFTVLAPSTTSSSSSSSSYSRSTSNQRSSFTSYGPRSHEESSFAGDEASDGSGEDETDSSFDCTDQHQDSASVLPCSRDNDSAYDDAGTVFDDMTLNQSCDFRTTSAICSTARVPSTTFFIESSSVGLATAQGFAHDVPRLLSAIVEAGEEEEEEEQENRNARATVSRQSANSIRIVLPPPGLTPQQQAPPHRSVSQPQKPLVSSKPAGGNAGNKGGTTKRKAKKPGLQPLATRKRRDIIKIELEEQGLITKDYNRSNCNNKWANSAVDSNPSPLTDYTIDRESWDLDSENSGKCNSQYVQCITPQATELDVSSRVAESNAQSAAASSNYIDLLPLQDTSSVYNFFQDHAHRKREEVHFRENLTTAYQSAGLATIEISSTMSSNGLSIDTAEDFDPETLRMSHERDNVVSSRGANLSTTSARLPPPARGQYCSVLYQSPAELTEPNSEKSTESSTNSQGPSTGDVSPNFSHQEPKKPTIYYRVPSAEVKALFRTSEPKVSKTPPPSLDLFELCSENFRPVTAASVHSSMENFAPPQNPQAITGSSSSSSTTSFSRGASSVSAALQKTRKLEFADAVVTTLDRSPPFMHLDCLTSSSSSCAKKTGTGTESSLLELLTGRSSQKPIPFVSNSTPQITMLTDASSSASEPTGQENRTPKSFASTTNTAPADDFNFGDWKNRLDSKLGLDDDFHIELKSPAAILRPISANTSRSRTAYTGGSKMFTPVNQQYEPAMVESEYKASRVMTSVKPLDAAVPRNETVKSTALNFEGYQQLSATAPPPNGKRPAAESCMEQYGNAGTEGSEEEEEEEEGLASVAGSMRKMSLTDRFRTTFRKRQIIDRNGYVERNDLNTGMFEYTTSTVNGGDEKLRSTRRDRELLKKKRGILARLRIRRTENLVTLNEAKV